MNQTHYLRPRLRRERLPQPIDRTKLIIQTVEQVFMLDDINDYTGRRREDGTFPRQIAHALLKKYTTLRNYKIGQIVGMKDHSTVSYSLKKIKHALETLEKVGHDQLGELYLECETLLKRQI